jgi:hypothetical protein
MVSESLDPLPTQSDAARVIYNREVIVMSQWNFAGTTALVALLAANPALADVSPEQVWENWKGLLGSYGQSITTGGEARNGDTLIVSNLVMESGDATASVKVTIDEMAFQDRGDGTVLVRMSEVVPVTSTAVAMEGDDPVTINMDISQPGMELIASGTAEETRYDFKGPSLIISMKSTDDMPVDTTLTMSGMVGNYIVTGTGDKTISSSFTADTADVKIAGAEEDRSFDFAGKVSGISGQSNSTMLANMNMNDPAAALASGFKVDGSFAYGASEFTFAATEFGETNSGSGSAAGGEFGVVMNKDALGYNVSAKGVDMTVTPGSMPFPFRVSYDESTVGFTMPVTKSETPGDFSVVTKIIGLTLSDEIWGMVDPMANLPRDPLSIVLDTKGKVRLNADLMDGEAMANSDMPGELHALELSELQVKGIGAEITGNGALTFDNSDLETFGGIPLPTGVVNLKAVGINGVMDKLVAMGLVPEDQVMGARMMMGMFAKVVEGETDAISSTLEFKDGGFFANGMRLQ